MIATLTRKDLRALLPVAALVALLGSGDVIVRTVAGFPDLAALAVTERNLAGDLGAQAALLFVLALSIAISLLKGERDRGTLEFLDSLPTTRSRVFAGKLCAGLLVLGALPLVWLAAVTALHLLSRTGLDVAFPHRVLAPVLLISWAQAFAVFGVALALAPLGRLAWVVALTAQVLISLLADREPSWRVLDVFALTTPELDGDALRIPWRILLPQLGGGLLGTAAAWGWFAHGDRITERFRRAQGSRGARMAKAAGIGLLVAIILGVGLLLVRLTRPTQPVVTITTRAYSITCAAGQAEHARELAARADAIEERVRGLLGAEPLGQIHVDATDIRPTANVGGLARWKDIRMDLHAGADWLAYVLAHETTHVYAAAMSDRRLASSLIHEGLAEHVACRLFPGAGRAAEKDRLELAVLRSRGLLSSEDFLDEQRLARRHHYMVHYMMGRLLIDEFVVRQGAQAPARFLAALRAAEPEGNHLDQLRQAFRVAGADLDRLLADVVEGLDAVAAREREWMSRLGRVRATVTFRGTRVGLRPEWEPPDGRGDPGRVWCMFRPTATGDRSSYFYGQKDGGETWVPVGAFPAGTVYYLCQAWDSDRELTLWDTWTEAPVEH